MTCTSKGRMPRARLRRFARDRERLEQQVVQQLAVLVALAELHGLGGELLVLSAATSGSRVVDLPYLFFQGLEPPALTGAQQLVDDLDHRTDSPGSGWLAGHSPFSHTASLRRAVADRERAPRAHPLSSPRAR